MATAVKKRSSKGKKRKAQDEEMDLGALPDISDLTLENMGQPSNSEVVTDKKVTDKEVTDNATNKQLESDENTNIIHEDDTFLMAHTTCDEDMDIKENATAKVCSDVPQMELSEDIKRVADVDMELQEVGATALNMDAVGDVLENPIIQEDSMGNANLYPDTSQIEEIDEAIATAPIMESDLKDPTIQEDNKECSLYPDISQMEIKEEVVATAEIIEEATGMLENTTTRDESIDNATGENTLYPDISKVELNEVIPSAPIIVEVPQSPAIVKEDVKEDILNTGTLKCIPLCQAEYLFCGKEIEQIKQMSRREEDLVENSLFDSNEHPLLELLATFKSSIISLHKESTQIYRKNNEEKLYREALWRVIKIAKTVEDFCPCGLKVSATVNYDQATLVTYKVPIGIMRTKGLLNDVQESYCNCQHAALLAQRQIDGVIQEVTLKTNTHIRVVINYLFHNMRITESSLSVFTECLKRWASALIPNMLKYGHLNDLLYVWHHLFRQNHSVSWAAELIMIPVRNFSDLTRAIALLDLLFESAYLQLDLVSECVEEGDDVWEEVDENGAGGAVAPNLLREGDILALLQCFPLRDIVARLVLIRHQKISGVLEDEWGDKTGGSAVLKSICGTRVLLSVLQKGLNGHPQYKQLAQVIVEFAIQCVCALADLHDFVKDSYSPDLLHQIYGELEAVFSALWVITTSTKLCIEQMPFSILTPKVTRACFAALSSNLHAETATKVEGAINIEIPADLKCNLKLLIITQMAVQSDDRRFVSTILSYLMQLSFTSQVKPCSHKCQETARLSLRPLLEKQHYLYMDAICAFSLIVFNDFVQASDIEFLSLGKWRPSRADVTHILTNLAQSNQALIPVLLDALDYTPDIGISYDTQLAIGQFLCQRVEESQQPPAEWYWSALRKMYLHRLEWNEQTDIDSVIPDQKPSNLFVKMFTLLTTAWGHSVPLICEDGVKVLLDLAKAGRTRETVYCLSYVMRIMAQSPESVELTPMFSEICNTLMLSSPTLVQRAFGWGNDSGSLLLTKLIISQLYKNRRLDDDIMQLLSAWIHMCYEHPTLTETALVCCHDYVELNKHMEDLLEDDFLYGRLSATPDTAPTVYLYLMRAQHTKLEIRTGLWQKLLCELDVQRTAGNRPNVDRALTQCNSAFTSDNLVIHKMCTAVLTAPRHHPTYIKLWSWFFSLYMQKPVKKPQGLPIGPVFFSGLLKLRTVAQLKKNIQAAADHHLDIVKALENNAASIPGEVAPQVYPAPSLVDPYSVEFLTPLRLSDFNEIVAVARPSGSNVITEQTPAPSPPPAAHELDLQNSKLYHANAHKLFLSYLKCLEDNYDGTATHNVFFEREQVLLRWDNHLKTITPASTEEDKYVIRAPVTYNADAVPPVASSTLTPLDRLKARLNYYSPKQRTEIKVVEIRPILTNIPANNTALVMLISQLINWLVKMADEWDVQMKNVASLNDSLWKLVRKLYVPHELNSVRRACSNNCEPITLEIAEREWVLSEGTRRAIQENRLRTFNNLKRILRPRSKTADVVAALHHAIGLVTDIAVATDIIKRAWRCATENVSLCPPARNALITVVTELGQEFICSEGVHAASLLGQWCRTEQSDLRLELLKTLVEPQKLLPQHVIVLYRAVMRATLPQDVRFSFLSKFDLVAWEKVVGSGIKQEMLEVITQNISKFGIEPTQRNTVLYELLCNHMSAVMDSDNLCDHLKACTRFSISIKFPRTAWTRINQVLDTKPFQMPYKKILMLMPELTQIWIRGSIVIFQKPELQAAYASYAKENVELMRKLTLLSIKCYNAVLDIPIEQFMTDLLSNSLIPSLLPWFIADEKRISNPLVSQEEHVNYAIEIFVKILNEICEIMPEATTSVLQNAFTWASYVSPNVEPWPRSSLLLHMQSLPWSQNYFSGQYVLYAIMLCCIDEDAKSFIRKAIEFVPSNVYLHGIEHSHIKDYLSIWLMGFTEDCVAAEFVHVIKDFPWYEISPQSVDMYLQRYFNNKEEHGLNDIRSMYKKTLKKHWLERPAQREVTHSLLHLRPGFKILREVSRLNVASHSRTDQKKRVIFMKHWVRSVTHINTDAEYKASIKALLEAVSEMYLLSRTTEWIYEILGHVVALLNVETDTSPCGIPVWCEWLASAPGPVVEECLRAVASVVNFKNHADVGDAALKAFLRIEDNNWKKVHELWRISVWRDEASLVRRGTLLAAYSHSSHPTGVHTLGDTVTALSTTPINIVQNEPAVALWMCHMTRRVYKNKVKRASAYQEQDEVINASIALLQSWAEERRLNLLRTFTRSVDVEAPTPHLRLIARLALCILNPSEAAVKTYENSHASIIRSTSALSDTKHFAKNAKPVLLPKLAKRLYPSYQGYFSLEYELMSKM